jgi:hypothetical protein
MGKLYALALAWLALHAGAAHAEEAAPPFSFRGFGTLGVVHSTEDQADFTSSVYKHHGAGHSHEWSPDVDSLLAGQITAQLTPRLSGVVQAIAEQRYDNTYTPTIEWANLRYELTPDFSLRAGRIVLPVFMVSDSRKVGYANPWVRPPIEVYSLAPLSTNDGIDLSHRLHAGDVTSTLQASYGASEVKFPASVGGTAKARHAWGVSYTLESGAATARIRYQQGRVSVDSFQPLFDGFRQFGAEGIAIADRYEPADKRLSFVGLGAMYDPGAWFLMGEWGAINTRSVLGKRNAWYASGGYRLGRVTPYLTYAEARTTSETSDAGLTVSAYPPFLAGAATALNAGLNTALVSSASKHTTFSIGARWDVAQSAALKLQVDRVRLGEGSAGMLHNPQPGFQPGGTFSVLSLALDFVF